eukprot:TRINITY_DN10126_c0_g1_i1.p1 TRINITY_DN10126_c0_g1~~TRINITY_DN10126_c0_g1_i1.p1  ORF type:complete len:351 (+),score=32.69 TRINITY_DN10126_c0_g1_i1:93-1145(+)
MSSRITTSVLILLILILIIKVVMVKVVEKPEDNSIEVTASALRSSTPQKRYDLAMTCIYVSSEFYKTRSPPSLKWVEAYLVSLFKARVKEGGSDLRSVVFVDRRTGKTLNNSNIIAPYRSNITIVEVNHDLEFRNMDWADLNLLGNAPNNFRFLLYRNYILKNKNSIDRVVISDSTDVYFQSDPFSKCGVQPNTPSAPKVTFTYEVKRKMDQYNKKWLRCYPGDVYGVLKKKTVSCAGVVLGTAEGIIRYCSLQVEQLSTPKLVECSIKTIKATLDQATHNYILHYTNSSLLEISAIDHSDSCTFHGNYAVPKIVNQQVVNDSGSPYAIVHQYTDRHPSIMDLATQLFLS